MIKCIKPLALACMLVPFAVSAAEYPNKPIRMLVGFAPGGGTDTTARAMGGKLVERARPADHHRQPAGRGRQHRHRDYLARQPRRLHDTDGHDRRACHQPQPLQETVVRPVEGRPAGIARSGFHQYPGRASLGAGQKRERTDRARQNQAAERRLLGCRRRRPSRAGVVQPAGRDQDRARTVQGRRPVHSRPGRAATSI